MRAVLDANVLVFVSAAIGSGPPHRILELWRVGSSFDLIACPRLLGEVSAVLLEWDEQEPPVVTPAAFEALLANTR